jgi:hypothetical protein
MRAGPFQLDFVGVGAARSGTTWLARCLAEHPRIWIPPAKELHYFDNDTVYEPTLARLREAFRSAPSDRLLGEFTPRYLLSPRALERIHAAFPGVRVLLCLRDPVERAHSQFCYFRFNMGKEPEADFTRALTGFYRDDYLTKSLYAGALKGLYALFPRARVHVVLYDDVRGRPEVVLREVFDFLGTDPDYEPRSATAQVNAARRASAAPPAALARLVRWLTYSDALAARAVRRASGGRVPSLALPSRAGARSGADRLDGATRVELYRRYFAADVEETERLLERDLSSWKPA